MNAHLRVSATALSLLIGACDNSKTDAPIDAAVDAFSAIDANTSGPEAGPIDAAADGTLLVADAAADGTVVLADAALDATVDAATSLTNHTFVINSMLLPRNGSEAMTYGLDIDERPSDGIDNQLGSVLGSLGALVPSLDLNDSLSQAIADGSIIQLVNIRAANLTDASDVQMSMYAGSMPVPTPCADISDTECGRHLDGSGMFTVDESGAVGDALPGSITASTLVAGPGDISLQLYLGSERVVLPLQRARASFVGLSSANFDVLSKIGGAVAIVDINAQLMPAMHSLIAQAFDADCDVGSTPPQCGCTSGSTGASLRSLFDRSPTQDCVISLDEVSAVVGGFLTPDIDLNADMTNDAISIGVGVTGRAATFTVPE